MLNPDYPLREELTSAEKSASPASAWWSEDAGFFGSFYLGGDDSLEGHLLASPQTQDSRTQREADGVLRLARLRAGDQVLDLPCGGGRHSVALASRGLRMTGVDLNHVHLQAARRLAAERRVEARFQHNDMRRIEFSQEFDAIINMFYSFGFFSSEEDNRLVIERFRAALKPGGRFLMHTDVNLQRVRDRTYQFHERRTLKDGGALIIDEHYDESTRRMEGAWTIRKDGQDRTRSYSVRVYEVDEFIELCQSCGFQTCRAYGDWHGGPCSEASEEIIFVAE
jgi:SAM-dependent methyltransferase